MVEILYSNFSSPDEQKFTARLEEVPECMHQKILSFHKWEDRYASLIGKLLLANGLMRLGLDNARLSDLKYSYYSRPYVNDNIDFNISHSGNFVVCVLSKGLRLGIDIEKIQPIELNEFREQYTLMEWQQITSSPHPLRAFYKFWTRKESVIKADGMGLSLPLKKIDVRHDVVAVSNKSWYLREFALHESYSCHLAASSPLNEGAFSVDYLHW